MGCFVCLGIGPYRECFIVGRWGVLCVCVWDLTLSVS